MSYGIGETGNLLDTDYRTGSGDATRSLLKDAGVEELHGYLIVCLFHPSVLNKPSSELQSLCTEAKVVKCHKDLQ